jgi:hypothetical protein
MFLCKDLPHKSHEIEVDERGDLRKKLALHAHWMVFNKRCLNFNVTIDGIWIDDRIFF